METRLRRRLASVVGHPSLQLIDDHTVVSDYITGYITGTFTYDVAS